MDNSAAANVCQKCGLPCSSCSNKDGHLDVAKDCDDFFRILEPRKLNLAVDNNVESGGIAHCVVHECCGHFHHSLGSSLSLANQHHATMAANLDLQHQIEVLKARLQQNNKHVEKLEHALLEVKSNAENETCRYQKELRSASDKYDRLLESHKTLQRVNQDLEEKVLIAVDKVDCEKALLTSQTLNLTSQLQAAANRISTLERVNEALQNDCSLAVRLLQCHSSSFLAHRFDDLPSALQDRVKSNLVVEEIKKLDEFKREREANDKDSGGLWSFLSLPSSLFVSTFPPSAAAFNLHHVVTEEESLESAGNSSESVSIDMRAVEEDVESGRVSTSVFARLFNQSSTTSLSPAVTVSSAINPTLDQEKLTSFWGRLPSPTSPTCDLSISSATAASPCYYKCRRCRLECVTCDRWTQTPLAPILSSGTCSLPSSLLPDYCPASTDAAYNPKFPRISTFPNLIASTYQSVLNNESIGSGASLTLSSKNVVSQKNLNLPLACLSPQNPTVLPSSSIPGMEPKDCLPDSQSAPPDSRCRHDSDTSSVVDWSDIHLTDHSLVHSFDHTSIGQSATRLSEGWANFSTTRDFENPLMINMDDSFPLLENSHNGTKITRMTSTTSTRTLTSTTNTLEACLEDICLDREGS